MCLTKNLFALYKCKCARAERRDIDVKSQKIEQAEPTTSSLRSAVLLKVRA